MGYSISWETHERINKNRREDRLCQGSGRCSSRATRVVVIESPSCTPTRKTFVCCKKHADELNATFNYYGYVFVNEPGSKILLTWKMGPKDHGTEARNLALIDANFENTERRWAA